MTTVVHERPHQGVAYEQFLPTGPFAILPMTGNRASLVWTEEASQARRLLALPEGPFTTELGRRFGTHLGEVKPIGPRWSYPLKLHLARSYVKDRFALVGDAAHTIHPLAGQGLNLGLKDVAALTETLLDAARLGLDYGQLDVLKRYERWRRFDSFVLAVATDSLNRLFSNDFPPLRWRAIWAGDRRQDRPCGGFSCATPAATSASCRACSRARRHEIFGGGGERGAGAFGIMRPAALKPQRVEFAIEGARFADDCVLARFRRFGESGVFNSQEKIARQGNAGARVRTADLDHFFHLLLGGAWFAGNARGHRSGR